MAVDLSKLVFYSNAKYLKRSSVFTSGTMNYSDGTSSIAHTVGAVAFFTYGADLFDDGVVWCGAYVGEYTQSSLSGGDFTPDFTAWCNSTELTFVLNPGSGDAARSGDITIYYGVYLDHS